MSESVLTASEPVGPAQAPADAAAAPARETIGAFSLARAKSSVQRRSQSKRERRGETTKTRFTEVTTVAGAWERGSDGAADEDVDGSARERDDARRLRKRESVKVNMLRARTFKAMNGGGGASGRGNGRVFVDVETGDSFVSTGEVTSVDEKRFRELDAEGVLEVVKLVEGGEPVLMSSVQPSLLENLSTLPVQVEVGWAGDSWRALLRMLMIASYDDVNRLRFTRGLDAAMHFLSGAESFLLGSVISAYESGNTSDLNRLLRHAFLNRNVSRVLVQQMSRYDIFWHTHWSVKFNRMMDAFGTVPVIGFTGFPSSENFQNTRNFVVGSFFRVFLGQGNWITRVLTGREALITDDPNVVAQNLAAETNSFEASNLAQHGAFVGRMKTNEFRANHRLPTDESVVRTFAVSPSSTLVNNGVVHVVSQLARHWHNMLDQPYGNFAHQRQEQLNPLETLRFHMPVVLFTLANLRGLNAWDSTVLAPVLKKLQNIPPVANAVMIKPIVRMISKELAANVCGGSKIIYDPFKSWLKAIERSLTRLDEEAQQVALICSAVQNGVAIGHSVIAQSNFIAPTEAQMKQAVHSVCRGEPVSTKCGVTEVQVKSALNLLAPRDKRMLIQLVKNGYTNSKAVVLLTSRACTLLRRNVRRDALSKTIVNMSKGDEVAKFDTKKAYWVKDQYDVGRVYIFERENTDGTCKFTDRATRAEHCFDLSKSTLSAYKYVEVGESIVRAQKAFMTIELDHGTVFSYASFMELSFLRSPLRQLLVLSQFHCEEIDDARLNVLSAIKHSATRTEVTVKELKLGQQYFVYEEKSYTPFLFDEALQSDEARLSALKMKKIVTVPPQSMIVIGGGPTGLLTTLHCLENVLLSDGVMRMYESRDAFTQAGATFERAQIVRLDARWIACLRFHLGTIYEDVFIPTPGDTSSHYGNVLPSQGFIEITIKDLENMMNVGVSQRLSRGLLTQDTNSGAQYDVRQNKLIKTGKALKITDLILRKVNNEGSPSDEPFSWKVVDVVYNKSYLATDLKLGEVYSVYILDQQQCLPYRLVGVNIDKEFYEFKSINSAYDDFACFANKLPSVYHKDTKAHSLVESLVIESVIRGSDGKYVQEVLPYNEIASQKFELDIEHYHVVEAIGKPAGSPVHFAITQTEPYGVACLAGLKVSQGMHNFGNSRWRSRVVDDIRSHTDQNTRIVGDFTKVVNSQKITKKMLKFITKDVDWRLHFERLIRDCGFSAEMPEIWQTMCTLVKQHTKQAPYVRRHLQTRFFETGDNFYLGMELTREYDEWKTKTVDSLVKSTLTWNSKPKNAQDIKKKEDKLRNLKGALTRSIDRLWYDATLETIRFGDVYNPGGQQFIPRLYFIDSLTPVTLGSLPEFESFRVVDQPNDRYDIIMTGVSGAVVRNVEGYVSKMSNSTMVYRGSNLTRAPNGNTESKVSMATFPVAHYVNHRTMRLRSDSKDKGYVFAFCGDEQSTPHFMRYSGLTGACVNSMLFNNFIGDAIIGVAFQDRFRTYSSSTNWSNGEVVTRGTGANYGVDGFLRPSFPYKEGVRYLYSKYIECRESDNDIAQLLTDDWKVKFCSALIPRGLEDNQSYLSALSEQMSHVIYEVFMEEVGKDPSFTGMELCDRLAEANDKVGESDEPWRELLERANISDDVKKMLTEKHVWIANSLDALTQELIEYALFLRENGFRFTSYAEKQPNPVDSVIDSTSVETQAFAEGLTMSAALAAAALVLSTSNPLRAAVLSAFTPIVAFGTITGASRYKNRNEEWLVAYKDNLFEQAERGAYDVMSRDAQKQSLHASPYVNDLRSMMDAFVKMCAYYNFPEPKELLYHFEAFVEDVHGDRACSEFDEYLVSVAIAETFYKSAYLQDHLVKMHEVVRDMMYWRSQSSEPGTAVDMQAQCLFERVVVLRRVLEKSIRRGHIRFGFIRTGNYSKSHVGDLVKFWINILMYPILLFRRDDDLSPSNARDSAKAWYKPANIAITETARDARALAERASHAKLARAAFDLESFTIASNESYTASFIILSALLSFCTGIVFTIGNIAARVKVQKWSTDLTSAGSYSFGLVTPLSAILALFWLSRVQFHIIRLALLLNTKMKPLSDEPRGKLKSCIKMALAQGLLTQVRMCIALATAVALPWALCVREASTFGLTFTDRSEDVPFYIASAAVIASVVSWFVFFWKEYVVRYNLPSKLGQHVCAAFLDDIEHNRQTVDIPHSSTLDHHRLERTTWEYAARVFIRKYRFDAVFGADRFGSLLQYVQSGAVVSARGESPMSV